VSSVDANRQEGVLIPSALNVDIILITVEKLDQHLKVLPAVVDIS